MTPRLAVPLAALLGTFALIAAPAAAQTCAPPSAEHAFEELLDIAADDSPLEDEAWRIADEREAADAFETPETLRLIDELARANDLTYDCASRRYVSLSHPDPRDAIENDEDPVYEGPTGVPDDGDQTAGGTGGSGSGSPSSPGGSGSPAGGPGSGSGASGVTGGGGGDNAPGGGSGSTGPVGTAGGAGSGSVRVSGAGGSESGGQPGTGTGGEAPPATQTGGGDPSGDEIGEPGATPDGEGGAVALPGGDDSPGALPWLAAGSVAAVTVVIVGTGLSGRGRRARISELT